MEKQTKYGVSLTYNNSKEIKFQLDELDTHLKKNKFFLNLTDEEKILSTIVGIYAELQDIHPFREGNTRTCKVYINEYANKFGYCFDFSNMTISDSMEVKFLLKSGSEDEHKTKELFGEAKDILRKYFYKYDGNPIDIFAKRPIDEKIYKKYKDKFYKLTESSNEIKIAIKKRRSNIREYQKQK
jgi:hypothetical protein